MKRLTIIITNLDVYFLIFSKSHQKMCVELLHFLKTNQFKEFIVSGGGIDFMREALSSVYEIPKDQIIRSVLKFVDEINNTNKDSKI